MPLGAVDFVVRHCKCRAEGESLSCSKFNAVLRDVRRVRTLFHIATATPGLPQPTPSQTPPTTWQLSSYHTTADQRSAPNKALREYEKRTGTKLEDHPLAKQLDACDSVESITSVIQEQARAFHEFQGDDGRAMKSLKGAVGVLYTLSTNDAFSEGISLVCPKTLIRGFLSLMLTWQAFPPAKAIFAGFAILPAVCPVLRFPMPACL
jgi:hypothetical protein